MTGAPRLRTALLFAGGLVLAGVLPLVGRAVRAGGAERCAFDGVAVPEATRVRVVGADGRERPFCCVDCADRWLGRVPEPPRRVLVRDEATGAEIPAEEATFVRSRVVSFEVTGCRIHVFAKRADADRHVEEFGGVVLEGDRVPLGGRGKGER